MDTWEIVSLIVNLLAAYCCCLDWLCHFPLGPICIKPTESIKMVNAGFKTKGYKYKYYNTVFHYRQLLRHLRLSISYSWMNEDNTLLIIIK